MHQAEIRQFEPFSLPYGQLTPPATGVVDLWLLPLQDLTPPLARTLQHDAALESEAAQRLTRKMMLRLLLAAYLGIPARQMRLDHQHGGKPYIKEPCDCGLHFSQTHSLDYVLIGVTSSGRLGVDLEPLSRIVRDPIAIARRYFARPEYEYLSSLPTGERQRRAFLQLWTRKEAVVKATGGGIVSGLHRFVVDDAGLYAPRLDAMPGEDVANWCIFHLEPMSGLVGSLAIDQPINEIRSWRVIPPAPKVAQLGR